MEKFLLHNQLEKIIKNITTYKATTVGQQANISAADFEALLKQVKNKEFVITVVGAMKSGKSSFTNALLGNDLMPNENQACTLTSTDIVHQEHDHRITKSYESGKSEILESDNLSSVFHQDVRKSRMEVQKEFYTYKVNHPIYGLKKYPYLNNIGFTLVDTPGLNEMEGLGVKKETIEQVFSHAMRRTDVLLFVIDVQYYKAEENLQIIRKIKQLRPDLVENIIFILNKVDKLRNRDGGIEFLVDKVKDFLNAWDVKTHRLYPVSSRKALIGRLVEQGLPVSNLGDEINTILPTKNIEVGGQLVTVQVPLASAYPQMIEESGILDLEGQILEEAYLQVENQLFQSSQVRLSQLTNKLDTVLEKEINRNNAEIQDVKGNQSKLKKKLSSLEQLLAGEIRYRNEVEVIIRNIHSQAEAMRIEKPFSSKLTYAQQKKSTYQYSSSQEALQEGISTFDEWFYKNTEPKFQSILSHYQAMLEYQPKESNYFHAISQSVTGILKGMNTLITTASKQLPDIKFHKLIGQLDIRPQGLSNIPTVDWKYKEFSGKIRTDSKTTEWEESFLLFFTQKRSKTEYSYDCSWAFNQAEKIIHSTLDKYSKEWHLDTIQRRFIDIAKYVQEMVLKPLIQLHNKVEPLIKDTESEILKLEAQLAKRQAESVKMIDLKHDVGFRTDLATRRKSITLTPGKSNLDIMLTKIESGTTIYLEEGVYHLKQKLELAKSLSVIGLGKGLTTIKVGKGAGVNLKGNHGLVLERISFEASNTKYIIEMDCLETVVGDCQFVGTNSHQALYLKGETEGHIQQSSFSRFYKGITLQDGSMLTSNVNLFIHNSGYGLELSGRGEALLDENTFIGNDVGVTYGDYSKGVVQKSTFTNNVKGIMVSGNSHPSLVNNDFNQHNMFGISVNLNAKATIAKNRFFENQIGVTCSDHSHVNISQNQLLNQKGDGLCISGKAFVRVTDNQFRQNDCGIVLSAKANAKLYRNRIVENRWSGIECRQNSMVTLYRNQIELNQSIGLVSVGNSQVNLRENEFTSNGDGIQLAGQTTFTLIGNKCDKNKGNGITVQGEAKGRISQNTCNRNQQGFALSGKCRVLMLENQSNENVENGIICLEKASGKILKNTCNGNGGFSLFMKKPLLIHHQKNIGKGALERPSSLPYWVNKCIKILSNFAAFIKKKEIMHNEY
ncbi:small GTP-binding protein domain-containing protein [Mesobacillus persicus]|uniref:Small GTP-binding protein domain-containing protein n=1 Tax=Mesobacillus persicus TaxID=930146 RepID=A0A1H8K8E7_9BACI|nr:right-handed parallel beta-helix repeat-containing protein [Mesobacillus persicus]SEN88678.1 small GTP-binding protein domain-containing protein [Mesobacillus persicus]